MRYQGNDALNRFFKFLQIGLFIYQGAASGNWNPGRIEVYTDDEDTFGARMTQHREYDLRRKGDRHVTEEDRGCVTELYDCSCGFCGIESGFGTAVYYLYV